MHASKNTTYASSLAQYDADMQSLIAELHSFAPSPAAFGRREFLKKVAVVY